jgi:hypothetical protein
MTATTSFSKYLWVRRKTRRKRASVEISWCPGSSARGKKYTARLLDISAGGVRILISAPLRENDVDVAIVGPAISRPIKRYAKVVWSLSTVDGECCVGLRFQRDLSAAEYAEVGMQSTFAGVMWERESRGEILCSDQ